MSVNEFESMLGAVLTEIKGGHVGSEELKMFAADGRMFLFTGLTGDADPGCGNDVRVDINDYEGSWDDLLGSPLTVAEEVSSEGWDGPAGSDSFTWSFYRFATIKGWVVVRWLGVSNGCYGESVDFCVFQGTA